MKNISTWVVLIFVISICQSYALAENILDPAIDQSQILQNTAAPDREENNLGNQKKNKLIQTGKVKQEEQLSQSPENVETIHEKDFNKYENKSVSKIINDSTSINNVYGSRGETEFKLRGFNQRQVPVLMDGIPIYIPYDGVIGLNHIPGYDIEKIEIIKSSPSIIYGPNTLGGAINIITRKPTEPYQLNLRFNDNFVNTLNNDLYAGGKYKNFYFSFNQSFTKSHGFNMPCTFHSILNENGGIRNNSAFHNLSLGFNFGYSSNEDQDYRISYQFLDNPWDVPPEIGINNPRYWKFFKWRKSLVSVMAKQLLWDKRIKFNGNFYYDKYFNILDSYDNNLYLTELKKYAFHSIYDDYSLGFNFIPEFNPCKYVTIKPVILYKQDIHQESGNTGYPLSRFKASTSTFGSAIEFNPLEPIKLECSISADKYASLQNSIGSLRDTEWALNTQGGISYFINPENKLYFTLGRKTRFPTLKELYSGFIGRNVPNPNLGPETAFSYEIGYNSKIKDRVEVDLSLFRSQLNNLIVNVPITKQLFQLQNIAKAVNQGVDVDLKTKFYDDKIQFKVGYSFLNAENKSPDRANNYIPYIPKNKIYAGLNISLPLGISLDTNLIYVSSMLYQDNLDLKWKKLKGYPMLNLYLNKKIKKHYNFFVSIENALDRYYETEARYPMPGLNIIFGFKAEI